MKEKNGFLQLENQFPLAGIGCFFKNWISPMVSASRKNLLTKEYCFKQRKIRFKIAGMENFFEKTFLLDEKTAYIGRISEKSKKIVPNSSDKSFKQTSL